MFQELVLKSPTKKSPIANDSYVGGTPCLPDDKAWPKCTICDAELTFYFQVSFPATHRWAGHLLLFFASGNCAHEDNSIPAMLTGSALKGVAIPKGFLQDYQSNFRCIVYSAKSLTDCPKLIRAPEILYQGAVLRDASAFVKRIAVGDVPEWLADDETPGTYDDSDEPVFLLQVPEAFAFKKDPRSPGQMILSLFNDLERSDENHYELFNGNRIYFFGFGNPIDSSIYIITQR